jgi:hypothetical protein
MKPSKEACEWAANLVEFNITGGMSFRMVDERHEIAAYLRSLHAEPERTCETCGFGLPSPCEPARCRLGMDHRVKHCAHWKPREAENETLWRCCELLWERWGRSTIDGPVPPNMLISDRNATALAAALGVLEGDQP